MFFSKSSLMFYHHVINAGQIPDDAIHVSDDIYESIIAGRNSGMIISADTSGYPVLIAQPTPTIEDLRRSMVLSAANARIKLATLGLLLPVMVEIDKLPRDNTLRIKWEYATELYRLDKDLVDFCKTTLGLDDSQIDELF